MLSDLYLHPSGQIPAYEWNFSDVNPPVDAFATLFNYVQEEQLGSDHTPPATSERTAHRRESDNRSSLDAAEAIAR